MMNRHYFIACSAVTLALSTYSFVAAQPQMQVTAQARRQILALIEADERWIAATTVEEDTRQYLTSLRTYSIRDDAQERRIAESVHFLYEGGITVRTTIDLDTHRVLKVERLQAYPTPLADRERDQAIQLAREGNEDVRTLLEQVGDRVRIEALAPVVPDKEDPRFGHRLVLLRFIAGDARQPLAVAVEVDLTTKRLLTAGDGRDIGTRLARDLSGEITQDFPVNAPASERETAWRIHWGTTRHAGGSEILYVREAHFRRTRTSAWIQVLGDCRLAEIVVPYNNGTRIYDITGYNFRLATLSPDDLGPQCIGPGEIYSGTVAKELHDNHLLWMNDYGDSRRSEELHLWSVLDAGNYRYIILYCFRMDGTIALRLGATAHNLFDTATDGATHLHTACWRLNVILDNPTSNIIQHVRYVSTPSHPNPQTVVSVFNGGTEGGIKWTPEEFTRVRVESTAISNAHNPPNRIGFELVPIRQGNARLYGVGEDFTQSDIWVTKASSGLPELRYRDLPQYVANQESISGVGTVLWHQSPLIHRPRDEDFGQSGYDSYRGSALTAWGGVELMPRNLFGKSPLYP